MGLGSNLRFIAAWARVMAAAALKPANPAPTYRGPTRYRRRGAGSLWRSVNPGVSKSWGKKGTRRHAKWAAKRRISEKRFADRQHMLHDVGLTAPKMLSPRALRRSLQRVAL